MKPLSACFYVVIFFLYLSLIGCSSTPKPPVAQISLNVQKNVNPYRMEKMGAEARPVVLRLYELTSLAAFNSTDFLSIFNDYSAVLGNELLHSEEFWLTPGLQKKFKKTLNLDTHYVGVVAAFKDLEHAQWRASTSIPLKVETPEIYVFLKENQVMIGAKKPCGFFCRLWTPKPPEGTLYEVIE